MQTRQLLATEKKATPKKAKPKKKKAPEAVKPQLQTAKETMEEIKKESKEEEEPAAKIDLIQFFNELIKNFFPKESTGKIIDIDYDKDQIYISDTKNGTTVIVQATKFIEPTQSLLNQSTKIMQNPKFQLGKRTRLWYDNPLAALENHEEIAKGQFKNIAELPKKQQYSIIEHTFPRLVDLFAWLYGKSTTYVDPEGVEKENKAIDGWIRYPDNSQKGGEFNFAWDAKQGLYHRWFKIRW